MSPDANHAPALEPSAAPASEPASPCVPAREAGRWSLRTRAAVVAALVAVATAGVIGLLIVTTLEPRLYTERAHFLQARAELESRVIQHDIEDLVSNLGAIVGSAALARCADGCAPAERQALVDALLALGEAHPHYLQLRLIDAAAPSMELVRVERARAGDPLVDLPADALQAKGHRPYVQVALREPGRAHLSPVDLNREHGRIQEPHQVVVRASQALVDGAGHPWAVVALNADPFYTSERELEASGLSVLVATDRGDFAKHPRGEWRSGVDLGHRRGAAQWFGAPVGDDEGELLLHRRDDARWVFARAEARVHVGAWPTGERALTVYIGQDEDAFEAPLRRQRTLAGLIALAFAALLGGLIHRLAWVVARPLEQLAGTACVIASGEAPGPWPEASDREVAVLSEAFARMHARVQDRTSRLNEEVKERDARNRELRALLEALPSAMCFVDLAGRVAYANPAARRLEVRASDREDAVEGVREERLVGRTLEEIVPDALARAVRALLERPRLAKDGSDAAEGVDTNQDFEIATGGARRFVRAGLVPMRWEGEPGVVLLLQDVTAVRREGEVRAAKQREESLRDVAIAVAHETNNALATLRMGHEFLAAYAADEPEPREVVADLERAAERVGATVDVLLTYSGTAHHDPRQLELGPWLEAHGAADGYAVEFEARRRSFVRADEGQLRRALEHLIRNAREADSTTAIRVRVGCTEGSELAGYPHRWGELAPHARYARISVVDHGAGMNEYVAERACDPLYSNKPGGNGFGLSTALGVVRAAHGGLAIRSTPGVGTEVAIFWPLEEAGERPTQARRRRISAYPQKKRILLVDDDPLILRATKRLLQRAGVAVALASGGVEALELLERDLNIEAVVSDIRMPGLDGADLLREIRERGLRLPVVLMSGQNDVRTDSLLEEDLALRFVANPFAGEDLMLALEEAAVGAETLTAARFAAEQRAFAEGVEPGVARGREHQAERGLVELSLPESHERSGTHGAAETEGDAEGSPRLRLVSGGPVRRSRAE